MKWPLRQFLTSNVIKICLLAFSADMIDDVTQPVQALFAIAIGATVSFVGLLATVSAFVSLVTAVPLGMISDKRGRKFLIVITFLLRGCGALIFSVAWNPYLLLAWAILLGVGQSTCFANLRAYVADTTEPQLLGRAVGSFSTAMGIGVTLGPLLGGFSSAFWGYRQTYLISSSFAFAGALVAQLGLPTTSSNPSRINAQPANLARLFTILRNPKILWLAVLNVFDTASYSLLMTYFPILGEKMGYSIEAIGFLFFARGLATTVIRIPIGLVSNKATEHVVMISTLMLRVATLMALPLTGNYNILVLLMIIQGGTYGAYLTSSNTFALRFAPQSETGTTLGLLSIFQGSINVVDQYVFGATGQMFGIAMTYLFAGSVMTVSVALVNLIAWRERVHLGNGS